MRKEVSLKPLSSQQQVFFEVHSVYHTKEIRDFTYGIPEIVRHLTESLHIKGTQDTAVENNAINIIIYSMLLVICHPFLQKKLTEKLGIVQVGNTWEMEVVVHDKWIYTITIHEDWKCLIERDTPA